MDINAPVWHVALSHQQVQTLEAGGSLGVAVLPPPYDAAVAAVISYVVLIDDIGGDQGVDITGVLGQTGAIVTPQGFGAYAWMLKGLNIAVAVGNTISDFVLKVAGVVPVVGRGVCSSPEVIAALIAGLPLPLVIVGGLLNGLLGGDPPPDTTPGAIKGNQGAVGPLETFVLMGVGGKGSQQVALLSWMGYFSAIGGGGDQVYANRRKVDVWETWTLLNNGDGTVSFRTWDNKHYMGTSATPDRSLFADQQANPAGGWTRFKMQHIAGGHVSLQTVYGTYVTVWRAANSQT